MRSASRPRLVDASRGASDSPDREADARRRESVSLLDVCRVAGVATVGRTASARAVGEALRGVISLVVNIWMFL